MSPDHARSRELAGAGVAILVSFSGDEELIALCGRVANLIDRRLTGIAAAAGLTPSGLPALRRGDQPR